MSNYEATKYDFDGANLTGIEGIPTATIVPWSSASVPSGFLECNGANVSRSTYAALFAVIGTTYGSGDGSSTFGLPDLQDNVAVGKSNNKALASTGGANTTPVAPAGNVTTNITGNVGGSTANATLSTAQLASHSHTTPFNVGRPGGSQGLYSFTAGGTTNKTSANAGSGQGHSHNMSANFSGSGTSNFSGTTVNPSILQPYLTIIYVIKT
jgi:microcystin-dependent protein